MVWMGQTLARLARIDPQLLSPVKHRSAKAQADLTVIRADSGTVNWKASESSSINSRTESVSISDSVVGTQFANLFRSGEYSTFVFFPASQSLAIRLSPGEEMELVSPLDSPYLLSDCMLLLQKGMQLPHVRALAGSTNF
jgi:hypothetical protein